MGPRARRRLRHHALIASAALTLGGAVALLFGGDLRTRLSAGTAYASLACLGATLALGPLNLIRGRRNPVSLDLRRDVGVWGGALGVAHAVIGLTVHMRGRMREYFLVPDATPATLRLDAFGIANQLGVLSALVLIVLVAVSNDVALRRLGGARWKQVQRTTYLAVGAMALHGLLYQVMERRPLPFVVALAAALLVALGLQLRGIRAYRARQSRGVAPQL